MANSTEYGLGSGIISQDLKLAEEISRRINAGLCFVN
jgi:acyl-CoA reductase-like NAD-dependent aldehyde dehydrogenase